MSAVFVRLQSDGQERTRKNNGTSALEQSNGQSSFGVNKFNQRQNQSKGQSMETLKLSRWQEQLEDAAWCSMLVKRVLASGGAIQIIEDVPYTPGYNRTPMKQWLVGQGVRDVTFKTVLPKEVPEQIVGNHKTFREFFLGKHPDCDVRVLGRPGEQQWMAIARLTQCMADYMDYLAERIVGR